MTQIYQMFLEANASEQAARMIAMKMPLTTQVGNYWRFNLTYNSAARQLLLRN